MCWMSLALADGNHAPRRLAHVVRRLAQRPPATAPRRAGGSPTSIFRRPLAKPASCVVGPSPPFLAPPLVQYIQRTLACAAPRPARTLPFSSRRQPEAFPTSWSRAHTHASTRAGFHRQALGSRNQSPPPCRTGESPSLGARFYQLGKFCHLQMRSPYKRDSLQKGWESASCPSSAPAMRPARLWRRRSWRGCVASERGPRVHREMQGAHLGVGRRSHDVSSPAGRVVCALDRRDAHTPGCPVQEPSLDGSARPDGCFWRLLSLGPPPATARRL